MSTVKVVLGAEAGFWVPAASVAVFAATVIPTVPSPVQLVSVTVGIAVVPFVTPMVQVAVPVVLKVIAAGVKFIVLAPVYVTVYVSIVRLFAMVADGEPTETVTPVAVLAVVVAEISLEYALLLPDASDALRVK